MARIRSIHPDMCVSETMAALQGCRRHEDCGCLERTFARLWTHCDDHGRATDNVRLIKAAIYPLHDAIDIRVLDEELNALMAAHLILRYEVDGKRYIEVRSWGEYQHPDKPKPSKYPPSTDGTPLDIIEPGQDTFTDPSPTRPRHVPDTSGPGEGGEKEREKEREPSRRTSQRSTTALAVVDGTAPGKPSRGRDPLWDALESELGNAATTPERSLRGKTRKELAALQATPTDVRMRCAEYRRRWPTASLTDTALVKHWSSLAIPQASPNGLSGNSQALLNVMAAIEAQEASEANARLGSFIDASVREVGA